jgi:energy-coupling factor transporter ATP-binding protein EcfA2
MRRFPGAKWWKFDFHAHTPASQDYGSGVDQAALQATTPEEWLLAYMRAEIDCVAVTDHNSGAWIDRLKETLARMEREGAAGFRPLYLFPGVEITANGGVHILAIFDATVGTAEINRLLGAVHARAADGTSDIACDDAPIKVVAEIAAVGGIPILAHVDEPKGLFVEVTGNTLPPILESPDIIAMEQRTPTSPKPQAYIDKKVQWAEVLGSDSHHPTGGAGGDRFPGSHYTWVKMGEPSLEGLRLALLDNAPLSLRRSDEYADNPNRHTDLFIEELHVDEARYCGRGNALVARFNPWLNAIIGGRGSGKSSLVEFMRIALQREDELPESLTKSFCEFKQVAAARDAKGTLTADTKLRLQFRKDGVRYAIQWSQDGTLPAIIQENVDGIWQEAPGEVRQRFPVRIFSQKQVYALSEEGEALLRILDETAEVNKSEWDDEWMLEQGRYLTLRARARELQLRLGEEGKIRGELDDVLNKLSIFEGAEHARLLTEYQLRQRQNRAIALSIQKLGATEEHLRNAVGLLTLPEVEPGLFDGGDSRDASILACIDVATERLHQVAEETLALANRASLIKEEFNASLIASEWAERTRAIQAAYEALVSSLQSQGVAGLDQYATLVNQRQGLEGRLNEMAQLRETIRTVEQEATECRERLMTLRRELSARREQFLTDALGGNLHVRIRVSPFGRSPAATEHQFRVLIDRTDGKFASDILTEDHQGGLIASLYQGLPGDINAATEMIIQRLAAMKTQLVICAGGRDVASIGGWFAKHLRQVQPETLDRLLCWFPEDSLSVEYSPRGNGRDFTPLHQGSPGQKAAAILAFLLAHGNEPIILDQPEDDLDNHLIYDLIVTQVRENKIRRQVIVITHNPNIVVNGDAEAVFALDQNRGQCRIVEQGCLQSIAVRDQICRIMEGGHEAFKRRYRRIVGSR